MLFKEIFVVYSYNHMKTISKLTPKYKVMIVEADSINSYNWSLGETKNTYIIHHFQCMSSELADFQLD